MSPHKTMGEFPHLTEEELLIEDRLEPAAIKRGVEAGLAPNKLLAPLRRAKDLLDSPSTRLEGESETYGICTALITKGGETEKANGLGALKTAHVFKRLRPDVGFALAIKAVRAGDRHAFCVIAGTMKREHPLHPDLAGFKTSKQETLGHMAAKCDHQEIIEEIAAQNPDNLESRGPDGETVAHTASRFCSWKTIDFLIEKKIELFGQRNMRGETPLVLAGGSLIRTRIELEQVRRAEGASLEKKETARTVLLAATKKKPGKPMVEIRNGRMRMERIPTMDPDIY